MDRWRAPLLALAVASSALGLALFLALDARDDRSGPTCAPGDRALRRIEMVFGLSRKDRTDVSDTEWSDFLAREVTPRFRDGLTVLAANGQWLNGDGDIVREPARVVLIWAVPAADLDNRVEHIRIAWRRDQRQDSVLRAYATDCVSF